MKKKGNRHQRIMARVIYLIEPNRVEIDVIVVRKIILFITRS